MTDTTQLPDWQSRPDRFAPIQPERMNEEQQVIVDRIHASPRAGVRGPWPVWLRNPEVAGRLMDLGDYVRFGNNSLSPPLRELAILLTARMWSADFEWWAHKPLALKAGQSSNVVDSLERGQRPEHMSDAEAAVYDFMTELYLKKRVSDETFLRAKNALGSEGIVDLIATTGYYCIVSMTLNVAEVGPASSP